jgi:hypothetical protein
VIVASVGILYTICAGHGLVKDVAGSIAYTDNDTIFDLVVSVAAIDIVVNRNLLTELASEFVARGGNNELAALIGDYTKGS